MSGRCRDGVVSPAVRNTLPTHRNHRTGVATGWRRTTSASARRRFRRRRVWWSGRWTAATRCDCIFRRGDMKVVIADDEAPARAPGGVPWQRVTVTARGCRVSGQRGRGAGACERQQVDPVLPTSVCPAWTVSGHALSWPRARSPGRDIRYRV